MVDNKVTLLAVSNEKCITNAFYGKPIDLSNSEVLEQLNLFNNVVDQNSAKMFEFLKHLS